MPLPAGGRPVSIDGLNPTIGADGSTTSHHYTWPTWNSIGWTERAEQKAAVLAAAFRETGR